MAERYYQPRITGPLLAALVAVILLTAVLFVLYWVIAQPTEPAAPAINPQTVQPEIEAWETPATAEEP